MRLDRKATTRIGAVIAVVFVGAIGCTGASTGDGAGSSGGMPAVGGTKAGPGTTGGSTSTGGRSSIGGAANSGGFATLGGATANGGNGGAPSTGGSKAEGGSMSGGSVSTGGARATGGVLPAGGSVATGGSVARGGANATGGVSSIGGSRPIGGTASTGGNASSSAGSGGASPGCGSANTTSSCSKSGTTCSIDVGGTARTYYVQLPSGYTSSRQYPVVFQFHPRGGTAEQALTMYGISRGLPDAIYVTPQGLTENGNTGWANTNGQDIAFTKAMVADLQAKYCLDNARIFSVGFSYGGMMSFAVGCEMGDVFRAIAPMSGALYSDFNCKGTGHAIAMWGSHGLTDDVVPIADGRAARDKILQQNHCGTQTVPIDPSPCVSYQGCDAGYPVTWCEWDGKHGIPSFGSTAIAAFFKQF
jgi:polyhydroxybutyrate depolymerase